MSSTRYQNRTPEQALYRKLGTACTWLKKHQPGFEEQDYRQILAQCGATEIDGRISAKSMDKEQMDKALLRLHEKGFPRRAPEFTQWRRARIGKLFAMWCALADHGHVQHKDMEAMSRFLERRVKHMKRLNWANSAQLNQCVEILKAWCKRVEVKCD